MSIALALPSSCFSIRLLYIHTPLVLTTCHLRHKDGADVSPDICVAGFSSCAHAYVVSRSGELRGSNRRESDRARLKRKSVIMRDEWGVFRW
jgi:hypothetical protein